jgi:hypothetical protein
MTSIYTYLLVPALFVFAAFGAEEPLAFPGVEGFGSHSRGGRGGRVIKVTNLNASGPGSLQAACQAEGRRIVVFEVSGVIQGEVVLTKPGITIAGQTAPGAGITIEGRLRNPYRIAPNLYDVIIRHVRVRPRPVSGKSAQGDCIQLTDIDRLVLDHVSCSWGSDENIDVSDCRDFTIQWTSIEESDDTGHQKGPHNFGMIMGYSGRDASVHHNLFAHHQRRAPLTGLELLDHRNNVIYNMLKALRWHGKEMNRLRRGKGFRANVINNYFKTGPNASKPEGPAYAAIDATSNEELYAAGNVFSWITGIADAWKHPLGKGVFLQLPIRVEDPWPAARVTTHSAEQAYHMVLAAAGCLPRDAVSLRTVEEVRTGTGSWGRHEPPDGLMQGLTPTRAPADSDDDGMPDAWERKHKLNPKDPSDGNKIVPAGASARNRHQGYTYIEFYINELADKLEEKALAGVR